MAESAGRFCQLCGEAAGLADRSCRRCGESLRVQGEGRVPAGGVNARRRRERSRSGFRFSVGFGAWRVVIALIVLSAACLIIGVAVGE